MLCYYYIITTLAHTNPLQLMMMIYFDFLALKSPATYFEQIQKLERARTGDILNKKMQFRPERDLLIKKHILEGEILTFLTFYYCHVSNISYLTHSSNCVMKIQTVTAMRHSATYFYVT